MTGHPLHDPAETPSPYDGGMEHRDGREFTPTGHTSAMQGVPEDAQLMGLDRNTEEGALVAMAGLLDRKNTSHQVVAWVAVVALAAPVVLSALLLVF